jgi:phosphoribosylanthranilate isomerase
MNVKLKVCGMRDGMNVLEVSLLRPDYMGFIFYDKSPRYVGENFSLPEFFPSSIKRVGVFVNETVENMTRIAKQLQLDYVQLHGHESVEVCQEMKSKGIGVIKVFSVDEEFDFNVTKPYQPVSDYFLFDTKGKYYGGNAQLFDWSVLKKYDQQVPFFLSGGITPDNIGTVTALNGMNIHALDVNSGVEAAPAMKSIDKLNSLISQITHLHTKSNV